ncbi:histidinol dehydrogenase [Patescibacteria group bacterium]|nr:histidinol dehydrogenase [Patescibacteria group bacterium]
MQAIKLKNLSPKDYQRIMARSAGDDRTIMPQVRKTMDLVKQTGDEALYADAAKRFAGQNFTSIKVTREEIEQAYQEVDQDFIDSIRQMIKNITAVQAAQLPKKKDRLVQPETGVSVWREWRAIEKVGLYIPGGKAIYPSSVLMSAIPAQIAGCKEIVMCSPARGTGQIPAPTLVAADMIGLTEIFKLGGPLAIAAMTYGTATVPKVSKIFGAGGAAVTAAKMLALESISIDMPAGPSEVFVIADETANPAFIAADLLADGEHGNDSACVLVTTSQRIAEETILEIEKQVPQLATAERLIESLEKFGLVAVVETLTEAIAFANDYAPEHIEIMTQDPEAVVAEITNAGSVFLGNWTAKSAGDYATGANHVLPTGGMAKMYPPLGVDCYGKWMQVQKCTKAGLGKIRKTIETLATIEELPAHKVASEIRFRK